MGVFVLITKYILWCYYHFIVWGTSVHSDNLYKTTLHICSQETAFCCFYGRIAAPPPVVNRDANEQLTLAQRGKFHENSIPILVLGVEYSCIFNNLFNNLARIILASGFAVLNNTPPTVGPVGLVEEILLEVLLLFNCGEGLVVILEKREKK